MLLIPPKLASVEALAFEGGGTLAHAYLPALECLARFGLLGPIPDGPGAEYLRRRGLRFRYFAGTSAGAIAAMILASGRTPAQLRIIQENTPWEKFADYRLFSSLRLFTAGGWHSLDFPRKWIAGQLEEAGYPGATFAELARATGNHLSVAATRYEKYGDRHTARPFVFSPASTPDAPIGLAALASMAVQAFWPPVEIDGWWFADGGAVANHPIGVFADTHDPDQVLGFRVDQRAEIERDLGKLRPEPYKPSLAQVVTANVGMLREQANNSYIPSELWARTVRIDVGKERALDFKRDLPRVERLRAAGGRAFAEWLDAV